MNCIIVDDEPLAVALLESYVAKTRNLDLLGSFTDSVMALNAVKKTVPDLLFLDIQMPGVNGFEFASLLPLKTKVIFVTAFKEYAIDSYQFCALDYLLKPVRYDKFLLSVEKASAWFGPSSERANVISNANLNSSNMLFIRVSGELKQICIDNILYVCGMKDYVMFYLENENKPLITYLRMKEVEGILPDNKFMRINRSYIIALDRIEKIDKNDCLYINNVQIHITEKYSHIFYSFIESHGLSVYNNC